MNEYFGDFSELNLCFSLLGECQLVSGQWLKRKWCFELQKLCGKEDAVPGNRFNSSFNIIQSVPSTQIPPDFAKQLDNDHFGTFWWKIALIFYKAIVATIIPWSSTSSWLLLKVRLCFTREQSGGSGRYCSQIAHSATGLTQKPNWATKKIPKGNNVWTYVAKHWQGHNGPKALSALT